MAFHNQTSHTLPSSPDFQFTISLPPPTAPGPSLRPADELFYNGHLLPLHLPPHTPMPRNLLTRHSGDYHSSLFYKTSLADHDHIPHNLLPFNPNISNVKKPLITQQFSFNKFSSVFRKEPKADTVSLTLRDKIRKYVKKISQFHGKKTARPMANTDHDLMSYSFTGNMRFLRKTSCVSSCPSTMPSSPNHYCRKGAVKGYTSRSSSSSEELQNAIEGAIAHCKNSMTR